MEAYCYCVTVSDKAEVRERIIEDKWIHNYCVLVKNRPNMATRIKNPDIKVWYKKDTEKGDINERFKAEDVTDPEPSPNKNVRTNVPSKVGNLQTNLSPRRTVCPSIVPSLSKGRNKILVRKEKLPRSSH